MVGESFTSRAPAGLEHADIHKKYESTYGNPAPESGEPGNHDHTGYDARSVVPVRSTVSPAIGFRPDHPSPSTTPKGDSFEAG